VIPGDKMKKYRGWWTAPWKVPFDFRATMKAYRTDLRSMMDTAKFLRTLDASLPQFLTGMEMYRRATKDGDFTKSYFPSGQVVGRLDDIPTCKELVERIVAEAEETIKNMQKKIG
jgi:NAD(P)H-dependent flavin oxidoreductase YrpB (nitropropane dioxygenase family)